MQNYKITNFNGFQQTELYPKKQAKSTWISSKRVIETGSQTGSRLSPKFPRSVLFLSFSGCHSPERYKWKKGEALLFKFSARGSMLASARTRQPNRTNSERIVTQVCGNIKIKVVPWMQNYKITNFNGFQQTELYPKKQAKSTWISSKRVIETGSQTGALKQIYS
ncbi:hypothetical protein CSKR_102595 [Clonorchis sinensis]|uniref:Uncharacterized protein n=1 Tax=Clonorchis sinensis TaxID=79923 RepID=A0A419PJS7_CLOSI|nr:hypothetical protein CSKR_102595 [Clonorchis sinensis]